MDTPGLDIVRNVGVGQEGEGTTGIEFYANFRPYRPRRDQSSVGRRGVYFHDPNRHLLEIITKPPRPVRQRWHQSAPQNAQS